MIIYLSGITDRLLIERDINFPAVYPDIMLSYIYIRTWKLTRIKGCNIFLDSSAYAAFNRKNPIKIDIFEYIDFIQSCDINFVNYVNLDVVYNPEETLKNQKIMEDAGLKPIPVYHWGDDISILQDYVQDYDYIGIGGTVPIGGRRKKQLSIDLRKLLDMFDTSTKKFHLFGFTSFQGIRFLSDRVYSVDSSTWIHRTRYRELLQLHGKTLHVPDIERYELARMNISVIRSLVDEVNNENIFGSLWQT